MKARSYLENLEVHFRCGKPQGVPIRGGEGTSLIVHRDV